MAEPRPERLCQATATSGPVHRQPGPALQPAGSTPDLVLPSERTAVSFVQGPPVWDSCRVTPYPQGVMLLREVSGHVGVQRHCVEEQGPQSHEVGGKPGEILTYLLGDLLRVVEHLGRQNREGGGRSPRAPLGLLPDGSADCSVLMALSPFSGHDSLPPCSPNSALCNHHSFHLSILAIPPPAQAVQVQDHLPQSHAAPSL